MVFGKTVPDISLNAVANLGYAEGRWLKPVYPGDTLRSESEVIGLKQNSNGKTGVVWVRTRGLNQRDEVVIEYVRWVMVRKSNLDAPGARNSCAAIEKGAGCRAIWWYPQGLDFSHYDFVQSGESHRWDATTRSAKRLTTSMASPSKRPSICWPLASGRTRPRCIST